MTLDKTILDLMCKLNAIISAALIMGIVSNRKSTQPKKSICHQTDPTDHVSKPVKITIRDISRLMIILMVGA